MAKYTVKFSCGHEGVVDLIGKEKDRQRRIEYLEGCGLCTECYKAKMRKKEAETPLTLAIQCNPLDTFPFRLVFSGNTLPVKDEIKKLGYSWGRIGTGGILNVLSKPTPAWYTDVRTLEELEEELKKATEVFPDLIIHRNFSQSDLIVYTEKQKKKSLKFLFRRNQRATQKVTGIKDSTLVVKKESVVYILMAKKRLFRKKMHRQSKITCRNCLRIKQK